MPIAVAAPVRVFIPTSCSASPRVRVMSSPGRASEPTARIQTTSGLRSTPAALLDLDQRDLGGLHRRVGHDQARPAASTTPERSDPATAAERVPAQPAHRERSPCRRRSRRPASPSSAGQEEPAA